MHIVPSRLAGAFKIELSQITDNRGYFMRTYDNETFHEYGLQTNWLHEGESKSLVKNTVRGLHLQAPPYSETKLIRVVRGAILDVFVDLRKSSSTYGNWDVIELSNENHQMIYIPRGFAHGFCSLTDDVVVLYKMDNVYHSDSTVTIKWDDPDIGIDWPVTDPVLSEKDKNAPSFKDFDSPFD